MEELNFESSFAYYGGHTRIPNYEEVWANTNPVAHLHNWRDVCIRDLYPKSIFLLDEEAEYVKSDILATSEAFNKMKLSDIPKDDIEKEHNKMKMNNLRDNHTIPEEMKPGVMMSILKGAGIDEEYAMSLFIKYMNQTGVEISANRNGSRRADWFPEIKKIHLSNGVTTVIWDDGTKTQVRCQNNDTLDDEKGLALAIAKDDNNLNVDYCVPNRKDLHKERKNLEEYKNDDYSIDIPISKEIMKHVFDTLKIPYGKPVVKVAEKVETDEGLLVKAALLHNFQITWNIGNKGGVTNVRATDHTDAFNRALEKLKDILQTNELDELRVTVTQIDE